MAELDTLLQQEIPNGRKALLDSKANLENVANYCQQMYVDSGNKKQALDETKNFTTQSLASVAYQINTLASNMLHMLDIQAAELANMESSINNISMTVDIHKEKVARREIGLLTTNKVISRNHQILAPSNPDRSVKYVRKPIDFSELDDIGHGMKLANQAQPSMSTRRISKTPSPSVEGRKRDSLKSTTSTGYGTIRAVRTPTVPQDYGTSKQQDGPSSENAPAKRLPSMFRSRTGSNSSSGSHGSINSGGGYYAGTGNISHAPPPHPVAAPPPPPAMAAGPPPPPNIPAPPPAPAMNVPPPPPMEGAPPPPPPMMAPPPPLSPGYSTPTVARVPSVPGNTQSYASSAVYDPPPPPPVGTGFPYQDANDDMPLPPPNDNIMPPPPDDFPAPFSDHNDSSSTAGSNFGSSDPSWAPKEYLQKVIAIYDYSAENEDELNLREDEIVYVVRKNDDGWFEGVLNGITGLFPGNYVETISV